jgi:glycosyltransferase involved in cell wall biosynthesis
MQKKDKIIVVMPAYNAEKTLHLVYDDIPKDIVDAIILVDDASTDNTINIAERYKDITVIRHPHNAGYGANQKTCYMEALRQGADIVIMVHPDNQYDPKFIKDIIKPIQEGRADIVLGSRMLMQGGALKGGMPLYKYIANKALTFFENWTLGLSLSEFHTGYRAYSKKFLETIPFLKNSNNFVFDSQVLIQAAKFSFRFAEVPVTTKYFPEASSVNFWVSLRYGASTTLYALIYILFRMKVVSPKFLHR